MNPGSGRPKEYKPHEKAGNKPPHEPGVYRIIDSSTREIKYIGETNDLPRRMAEHMHTGKLKDGDIFAYQVADPQTTSKERRDYETKKIQQHGPPLNQVSGGGGRIAK